MDRSRRPRALPSSCGAGSPANLDGVRRVTIRDNRAESGTIDLEIRARRPDLGNLSLPLAVTLIVGGTTVDTVVPPERCEQGPSRVVCRENRS